MSCCSQMWTHGGSVVRGPPGPEASGAPLDTCLASWHLSALHTAAVSIHALSIRRPCFFLFRWTVNVTRSPNAFFLRDCAVHRAHGPALSEESWISDFTDQSTLPPQSGCSTEVADLILCCFHFCIKGSEGERVWKLERPFSHYFNVSGGQFWNDPWLTSLCLK